VNYDRKALIEARAMELTSSGATQYEVAEDGLRGIDSMGDAELKSLCDYHGIDCEEETA